MNRNEWWRDFFSGLANDMWRMAIDPAQTTKEADFIGNVLQLLPPAALLDVPCGNGRLSMELASRGFAVTGADLSQPFVKEAQTASRGKGLAVEWHVREMRDLPWQDRFDGAFCFGNSFGYLDDQGNTDFLKTIHRVLKPGGRFLLDASSVAENVLRKIEDHTEMEFGDIVFKEDNHYDHRSGRLETEYTFVRGGQTEKKFGSHRIYTFRELEMLLAQAGFENSQAFGSVEKKPFKFGSHALYLLVSKE
ncbi:MAG: class I SAM-dependent methyltransferase [Bacteroidota bacterium]